MFIIRAAEEQGRYDALREIRTLHKPFNLERLCALAAEMTA